MVTHLFSFTSCSLVLMVRELLRRSEWRAGVETSWNLCEIEMRYQKLHYKTKLLTKSNVERLSKMVSTHLWNTSPLPIGQWYWCIAVCEVGGVFFRREWCRNCWIIHDHPNSHFLHYKDWTPTFKHHLYVHPTSFKKNMVPFALLNSRQCSKVKHSGWKHCKNLIFPWSPWDFRILGRAEIHWIRMWMDKSFTGWHQPSHLKIDGYENDPASFLGQSA